MIKFFRKIRQQMLNKNKTGQYLKYAIGEIILVVIGILVALQINSWHEENINSGKEKEYLAGFKNDLEKQIASFETSNQYFDRITDVGEGILIEFSTTASLLDIDSINTKLASLMYSRQFPEVNTTFNELNSTSQFTVIRNKTLRSNIIKYYQNSESRKKWVDGNTVNVIYNQIFPIINSSIIVDPKNFGFANEKINLAEPLAASFQKKLSNPNQQFELVNAISLRLIVGKRNKIHFDNSKEEAEELLAEINKEMDIN